MVWGYRYIIIEEDGKVQTSRSTPIEGLTIDTDGMNVPEMPTDAIYALYYNEERQLHWIKVAEFESVEPTQLEQLRADMDYFKMMEGV